MYIQNSVFLTGLRIWGVRKTVQAPISFQPFINLWLNQSMLRSELIKLQHGHAQGSTEGDGYPCISHISGSSTEDILPNVCN